MPKEPRHYLCKLNPAVKLFTILFAVFAIALIQNTLVLAVHLVLSLTLAWLARPKLDRAVIASISSTLIGYSWVTYVLFLTNLHLDPSLASTRTLLLSTRILIIILYSLFFISTTSPKEIAAALTLQLHIPYVYSYMSFVSLRMFPLVRRDLENMIAFRKIKGYFSLRKPWRLILSIASPLLFLVVKRSITLGIAMEARGFGKYPHRVFREETSVHKKDILFALIVVLGTIFSLLIAYTYNIPLQLSL
ncbi:MAG: energy-coupling factor transporter transmembrane component T [Infirmifilum sp.]